MIPIPACAPALPGFLREGISGPLNCPHYLRFFRCSDQPDHGTWDGVRVVGDEIQKTNRCWRGRRLHIAQSHADSHVCFRKLRPPRRNINLDFPTAYGLRQAIATRYRNQNNPNRWWLLRDNRFAYREKFEEYVPSRARLWRIGPGRRRYRRCEREVR